MDADGLLGGRYRRVHVVGVGAMGEVWQGEDTLLQRTIAIKRILAHGLAADPTLGDRLLREARLAARLDHPHAVTVHDVVVEDGLPHLVMQFVTGQTLAQRIAQRPLVPPQLAPLLTGVADALATAHGLGIVHRDIKPSNILLDARGRALLADFGIARGDADSRLTGTGSFIGTPAYLAPELARGEDASPASDVYALGATMYAAVDGRAPFDDGQANALTLLSRVLTQSVPPPRNAGPFTGLLMAMLAPDPWARPSAAQVVVALGSGPAASSDDSPTVRQALPAEPEEADPLSTLVGAIDHAADVTHGWSGTVDDWQALVFGELEPVLGADDRVDLFVPSLFALDDRRRHGLPRQVLRALPGVRSGVTLALDDRLVCAWNSRANAQISITIEYEWVEAVVPSEHHVEGATYRGFDFDCGTFVWPVFFAPQPGLESLRHLLGGRPSCAVRPQWDADRVTSWIVPDGRGGTTLSSGWRDQQGQ